VDAAKSYGAQRVLSSVCWRPGRVLREDGAQAGAASRRRTSPKALRQETPEMRLEEASSRREVHLRDLPGLPALRFTLLAALGTWRGSKRV